MTNPPRRESAKIYRFPTRLRAAVAEVTRSERATPAVAFPVCVAGSGWYHEAAIQDESRDRKP